MIARLGMWSRKNPKKSCIEFFSQRLLVLRLQEGNVLPAINPGSVLSFELTKGDQHEYNRKK